VKVEIAFDLSANGLGSFFTLDDATRGVLDNTLYTLGGDLYIDVTDTVRSVSVKRGRNRQLEKFTAGNANLVLDNRSRVYDPTNTAGPYYNQILPRKRVRITEQDQVIYTGQVADWNFDYSVTGDSTAQVSCVDALTLLVDPVLTAGTGTPQLTGARVTAVLDDIAWPLADRRISVGQATLGADVVVADVKALDYLNKVSLSDPGALFVGNDGFLVFLDRADLQNASNPIVFGTGGVPFTDIGVEFGIEELSNDISVTYYGGTAVAGTAVAINETSIAQFGVFDTQYNTLLASDSDAQALADFQISRYAQPQYRVDTVTVNLDGIGLATQQTVLALELGDVVTVTWTPNGVGSALSQTVTIDAIDFVASPSSRLISFTMSETAAGFILDSSVFGVLDTNALAF
jgi:hypothetical protein